MFHAAEGSSGATPAETRSDLFLMSFLVRLSSSFPSSRWVSDKDKPAQAFSLGGITIDAQRCRLKGDIVEALQWAKCAIRLELLFLEPEFDNGGRGGGDDREEG
jgi:hypothetical protein